MFLNVDDDDDDNVVIGDGISFVICGSVCGDDSIDFLCNGFFFA